MPWLQGLQTRVTGLWRDVDFLKLWAGQTVSLFGSQVTFLALPLTAVLMLKATPLQVGILTAVGAAPALLLGVFVGAWVDRVARRPLMITADVGRFLLLGLIPLAALAGVLRIELLYGISFGLGILTLLFDVAYQAFLPHLVAREQLVEGNSKLELSRSAADVVGPGLGGALVQLFSAPVAIAADAVTFLVSALSLGMLHTPEGRSAQPTGRAGIWREIGEGLAFVAGQPVVRALVGSRATLILFNNLLEAIFILYLARSLGLAPALIGTIFTIGSVGFLVGAVLASRVTRRLGVGTTLLGAPLLIGLADLCIPAAGWVRVAALPLLVAGQFLFGLGRPIYNINRVSLSQAVTPEALQGRTGASSELLTAGAAAVGAIAGGVLGQRIGLQPALVIAAGGEMLSCLWIALSPVRQAQEQTVPSLANTP